MACRSLERGNTAADEMRQKLTEEGVTPQVKVINYSPLISFVCYYCISEQFMFCLHAKNYESLEVPF